MIYNASPENSDNFSGDHFGKQITSIINDSTAKTLLLQDNRNMDIQSCITAYKQAKIRGEKYVEWPTMKIDGTKRGFNKMEPGRMVISEDNTFDLTIKTGDILQADLHQIYDDQAKTEVLNNIKQYTYASERTEIQDREKILPYQNYIFSFDFQLPKDFPNIDNRLVIGQRKQSVSDTIAPSPVIAQRYRNGKFFITKNTSGSKVGKESEIQTLWTSDEDIRGQRNHLEYQVRFSDKEDGYLKIFFNNKEVFNQSNFQLYINNDNDFEDTFYFKFGLYRDNYLHAIEKLKEQGKIEQITAIENAIKQENEGHPMQIKFRKYQIKKLS